MVRRVRSITARRRGTMGHRQSIMRLRRRPMPTTAAAAGAVVGDPQPASTINPYATGNPMKRAAIALMISPLAIAPAASNAAGCIKGAIVGGVAGHYAHHHA